jgi:putative FmdB family regulatory protein
VPAYEYLCKACGGRFELRQKMSDAPVDACPVCGGSVERLISGGAGAICKGSTPSSCAAPGGGSCCAFDGASCCGQGSACHN